jgi:RNA polymerase sigma-70 factor (ECF subfamily)
MDAGNLELDETALLHLYERLERSLYNVVYRFLWTPEDSQEIVQEAFLRLWRMRARVRMDSVEPLVYRIAINLARSGLRRRRLWRWVSLEALRNRASHDPGAEELAATAEARGQMRQAIEALPMDLRMVVVLCELAGLSYQQVAEAVGIPVGTVGSRRHRAMELLRKRLRRDADAG